MVVWAMQGVLKPHTYVHREKHLFPTIKINVSSQQQKHCMHLYKYTWGNTIILNHSSPNLEVHGVCMAFFL